VACSLLVTLNLVGKRGFGSGLDSDSVWSLDSDLGKLEFFTAMPGVSAGRKMTGDSLLPGVYSNLYRVLVLTLLGSWKKGGMFATGNPELKTTGDSSHPGVYSSLYRVLVPTLVDLGKLEIFTGMPGSSAGRRMTGDSSHPG
jgi:hypothetical protein